MCHKFRTSSIFPIAVLIIIHCSLLISSTQDCLAQNNRNPQYLPQYNLWLPGSRIAPPVSRLLNTDSVFSWQAVQLQIPFFISDVFFIDSLYGWASHTNGGIFRTTNSGFNWDTTQLTPGESANLNGVYFLDRNTGWVVGQEAAIRKTTNGGINWIIQDWPGPEAYYMSVHFFNSNTGIVTGFKSPYTIWNGYIIKTTDGGTTWNEMYLSTDTNYSSTEIHRQYWLNNDTGWLAGYNILLRTNDGGLTYTNYYSHVPPTQNGYNALLDLYFTNENTGWICGGNLDRKNVYKTTNVGENWIFQDNPVSQQYYYSQIDGIIFISPDTGWASTYVGVILITTNAGTNWLIDKSGLAWNNKFARYKNSKVWLGALGYIYYTCLNNPIGIINNNRNIPKDFKLEQNYPNPFNPTTKIIFSIPLSRGVRGVSMRLTIYDILGREITTLVNEQLKPGSYEVEWDGSNYPSGVYFYKLQTENFTQTKKLVLLK